MKIIHDMHTHTTYSHLNHGKNTIDEMVEQARKIGLKEITISDHGRSHPFFGVRKNEFKKMRQEIDALNQKYDDIKVYLSVESNITGSKGDIDIKSEEKEYCDYIHAGFHYGFIPARFSDIFRFAGINYLTRLFPSLKEKARKINTASYVEMMERYDLKMITHPGDKAPVDIETVARKAAEKGVILEINGRHSHLNEEELSIAMKYDVKFAINSDAHHKSALGKVSKGIEIAQNAKVPIDRIVNMEE
jgi:putative hydrolase